MTALRTNLYKSIHDLKMPPHPLRDIVDGPGMALYESMAMRGFRLGGHNSVYEPIIIDDQNQIIEGLRRWNIQKQLDFLHPDRGFDQIWCQLKEHSDG